MSFLVSFFAWVTTPLRWYLGCVSVLNAIDDSLEFDRAFLDSVCGKMTPAPSEFVNLYSQIAQEKAKLLPDVWTDSKKARHDLSLLQQLTDQISNGWGDMATLENAKMNFMVLAAPKRNQ